MDVKELENKSLEELRKIYFNITGEYPQGVGYSLEKNRFYNYNMSKEELLKWIAPWIFDLEAIMFDKENIARINFTEYYRKTEIEYIALFNKNKTTVEEVKKAIDLHGMGENSNVIIITKEQFENVFD